jgi:HAD superfamily hydrolase (TIGR01484 family)
MKILGSDFDGTLTAGGITEAKLSAIRGWQAAGHKFGIISGRGADLLPTLKRDYPALHLDFYAACNGGYISDGEGRILWERVCRRVTAETLLGELFEKSERVYIKVDGRCRRVARDEGERAALGAAEDAILLGEAAVLSHFHCFSACLRSDVDVGKTAAQLREAYGAHLNPLPNGNWIDIVPRGVNKAEGLLRVAEHYGASPSDVIAVGDNGNDADMLRAFHSYAMENGTPEVKALADATVSDVCEIIRKEI